ncbi:tyrosine phosphatase family-domain-containing protein [Scheffersomyces amazonensis]|uniref:tyrosine phosphatase family-domain-containing protein n=1 Tax=Scheffersomyces amazonensis TaxID=1078765 RepID=UPI00315C5701
MSEFSEDPFQMDEELPSSPNTNLSLPLPPDSTLEQDITKAYEDISSDIIYGDNKLIRSKLEQFKLEEQTGGTNTTEDESQQENTYEEDLDDKLDYKLQEKLKLEYEAQTKSSSKLPLTPPENFSTVVNKIYRSSFPQPLNFSFLKTLKLKSILCLIPEDYPQLQLEFLKQENIKLFQLGMSGNKEPFVKINHDLITEAIKIVINPENQPILIHCNRGKHRTGCLIGVLRRLQKWSLTIIFDEYRKFAAPKERPMDQQFIELYDETEIIKYAEASNFLPIRWD